MQTVGVIVAATMMLLSPAAAQIRMSSTSSSMVAEEFLYRDYRIDLSRIIGHVNLEAAKTVMRKQVDLVEDLQTRPELKHFFRSVRIELASDLTMGDGGHARGGYVSGNRLIKMTALIGSNPSAPVLVHELAHAVHAELLPQGFNNPQIKLFYDQAKQSSRYPADAYIMRNEREYFAVASAVFLHGTDDHAPYTRSRLKEKEPQLYAFFVHLYGAQLESANPIERAGYLCFNVNSAGPGARLSWLSSIACR